MNPLPPPSSDSLFEWLTVFCAILGIAYLAVSLYRKIFPSPPKTDIRFESVEKELAEMKDRSARSREATTEQIANIDSSIRSLNVKISSLNDSLAEFKSVIRDSVQGVMEFNSKSLDDLRRRVEKIENHLFVKNQ